MKVFELAKTSIIELADCLQFRLPLTEQQILSKVERTSTNTVYPNLSNDGKWFNAYTNKYMSCRKK